MKTLIHLCIKCKTKKKCIINAYYTINSDNNTSCVCLNNFLILVYNEVPNIKTIVNNIKMFYLFSKLIIVMSR